MRYLLALLLLTSTVRAADVRYTFGDFTTSPSSVRRVQITPIQGYNATGSTIITGDRRTFTNDSSGVLIVSNVVVGASYRVDLNGQYTVTSFTNTFPSGTTGLVEAVDYISVPTNAAGTVAYSMASSDNRYATIAQVTNIVEAIGGGGDGGTGQTNWPADSITNAPWAETADLGTAAFSDSTDFDPSGAALSATNGLGAAAFHPATDFLGLHAKADTAGTADIALAGWPTTWLLSSITDKGTAAYSNASAFYLSSNPSSYITLGDIPAQRTQWSVATVTNAGTAAYSNAAAFLTPAQVGTAAYSNSTAFDPSGAAQSVSNNLGTAAFHASTDYDASGAANSATNVVWAPARIATNTPSSGQILTATSSGTARWALNMIPVYGGYQAASYNTSALYGALNAGGGTVGKTTESLGSTPWVVPCTLTNLIARLTVAPAAGTNFTMTVFTNGVASNLATTIVGNGALLRSTNTTSSVFIDFGTTVSIEYKGNNVSLTANMGISWAMGAFMQ